MCGARLQPCISGAFWALEVMSQNINQCFLLKMKRYWSVGLWIPKEKLWMGDAGGQPALSVLIPAVPKHALYI